MSGVRGMGLIDYGRALAAAVLCAAVFYAAGPVGALAADGDAGTGASAGAFADLLAHGSGDRFWVARVHQDPARGGAFITDVFARPAAEGRWTQVVRVEGRALDVAHRGSQLALLLDGGGWLLASEPVVGTEQTIATGRPPPPGARLLSIAARGDSLLALARVYEPSQADGPSATSPATTSPATTSPAATPSPSRAPSSGPRSSRDPERLVLLALGPQGWTDAGSFETDGPLPAVPADVSLAVVEGAPYIAVREGSQSVGIYRPVGAPGQSRVSVETKTGLVALDLLGGGPVPVLWTVEAAGTARLHWLTQKGVQSIDVDLGSEAIAGGRPRAAAAIATERVRVVYGSGLALSQRTFDALAPSAPGPVARVSLPRTAVPPVMLRWLEPLLTVLLLFTIISSLRRRREMQETMQSADRLPLAPFGRRFLGGIIDAAPIIGTVAVLAFIASRDDDAWGYLMTSTEAQVALLASLLVYLAHTAASEIASGRTLGKICCGLRVVGLDGERPSPGALLTRNLLRLIDLSMMFFPLVLVLYSPLRQRAGDVAAGTLVVLHKVGAEAEGETVDDAEPAKAKEREPVELAD